MTNIFASLLVVLLILVRVMAVFVLAYFLMMNAPWWVTVAVAIMFFTSLGD